MIKPGKIHQRVIYLSTISLWLSGVLFLFDRFLADDLFKLFAPRSELQVTAMKIHGALAIIFIFVFGTVYAHFQRAWPVGRKRLSGLLLAAIFIILCVTMWPLYYSSEDFTRQIAISAHSVIGFLVPGFIILHVFSKKL